MQLGTAFENAGIDHNTLADQLRGDGADSFDEAWHSLLASIATKCDRRSASPAARGGR